MTAPVSQQASGDVVAPMLDLLDHMVREMAASGSWDAETMTRVVENVTHWTRDFRTIALSSAPSSNRVTESPVVGWLIESDVNGPLYQRASGSTRDASEALRFARQQDAEAYIGAHGPNHYSSVSTPAWRAVEHCWG